MSLHMRECHLRASGGRSGADITPDMRRELAWAKDFVNNSPPRILRAGMSGDRTIIFTDAFLDDQDRNAGGGMVMYKMCDGAVVHRCFFSEVVPEQVLKRLQTDTPKVIAALELMAAIQAVMVCERFISESRAFLFVDNEAARANLISMTSPVTVQANLLRKLYRFCSNASLFLWTSRVPSLSNPADAPSRFETESLLESGFTRVHPSWQLV